MSSLIILLLLHYDASLFLLLSSPSVVKNNNLRRQGISAGTSRLVLSAVFPKKGVARETRFSLSFWPLLRNNLKIPISVYSCYTPELLCGGSSNRCALIVYRDIDGGSAKQKGKLRNVHCMYSTQV